MMGKNERIVLPDRVYRVLEVLIGLGGRAPIEELARSLGRRASDIQRDLAELERLGLVKVIKDVVKRPELTPEGVDALENGLPEVRVLNTLEALGGEAPISELVKESGVIDKGLKAALGRLRRAGLVEISGGIVRLVGGDRSRFFETVSDVVKGLREVTEGRYPPNFGELRKRRLVKEVVSKTQIIEVTREGALAWSEGRVVRARVITALTPEILKSGEWEGAEFKEFDLSIDVPTMHPVRKHPYVYFLQRVREILVGMGFVEVKGPHIESELLNFDALFVPQYHPARRGTDVYFVKGLPRLEGVSREFVERVKEIHEKGWRYKWSPERALRLVLRTHTTPVSIRTLMKRGAGEYRVFSLDRVFRPDTPDPTHLMEFHQLEGIIVGKRVTFRHLLGFFTELAKELGLGEVMFRPAYFPFTEPSVEGYIKHPKLCWIEVFPGGMFRPEVLEAAGVSGVNVAAWGIGIDRIAMLVLGINDIRDLYTNNLTKIRSTPYPKEVMR